MNPYPEMMAFERNTIVNITKYIIRAPVKRIRHKNVIFAKLFTKLRMATDRSGAIGLPYALKIWTLYDNIPVAPVNSAKMKSATTINNGFSVCFRFNSLSFSSKVGNGWPQFRFCLTQDMHDVDRSLYLWRSLNSCAIAPCCTQPRSQHNDFSASLRRFFDRSHIGVSGIWKTNWFHNILLRIFREEKRRLTKQRDRQVRIGINRHTRATKRHDIKVFKMNTSNDPSVPHTFV